MDIVSVVQLINKIDHFSKVETLSKNVRRKLINILDDIADSNEISMEELVIIIAKNNRCSYEKDQLKYRKFMEDLALETSEDFHHAVCHIFSDPRKLGMVYKDIDISPAEVTYGELVAIKNQLVINGLFGAKLDSKNKDEFPAQEFNNFVNDYFTDLNNENNISSIILSKVILSLYVIFDNNLANNKQILTIMKPEHLGMNIFLSVDHIYNMMTYLVEEQFAVMSKKKLKTVNIDLIYSKLEDLMRKFKIYISLKKNGYISEPLRNLYEMQELLEKNSLKPSSPYNITDINPNQIVYANATANNPLHYFLKEEK